LEIHHVDSLRQSRFRYNILHIFFPSALILFDWRGLQELKFATPMQRTHEQLACARLSLSAPFTHNLSNGWFSTLKPLPLNKTLLANVIAASHDVALIVR
jgi:hypothetical protein